MVEYALLAGAALGVFALGKMRGGLVPALLTGLAAAGGFFILRFALPGLVQSAASRSDIVRYVLPWGWVAAAVLFALFGLGRKKDTPGHPWVCPACNVSNCDSAIVCQTCGQPYIEPDENDNGSSPS